MKPPKLLGKIVYFFGYPIFRLLIKDTNRAYVLVYNDNQILLTKNWLGFQKKWRLPGGGIQYSESPVAAALREVQEEIGLQIDASQMVLLTPEPVKASFNYSYYLFACKVHGQVVINPDEREILEAKFIDKNQLSSIVISEEARIGVGLIGWL